MKKYTFIDLFSGCGGLSEGFMQSDYFEGLVHVEWELPMVRTLRNRLINKWGYTIEKSLKTVIHFDLQKSDELLFGDWSEESLMKYSSTNDIGVVTKGIKELVGVKKVDFIIGGPPCQAYSIAGRARDKNSMKNDYRNFLFESFVKVVAYFQPRFFVFENVPGMLSAKPGNIPIKDRIYEAFDSIGYEIVPPSKMKDIIFNAYDFDVPQDRKRLIIIGIKKDTNDSLHKIYSSILSFKKDKKVTVRDAFENLPKIIPIKGKNDLKMSHKIINGKFLSTFNHEPRYHNSRDISIFYKWIDNDMNSKSMKDKKEFYYNHTGKSTNYGKYRNLEWMKPSPTLVAHLQKDGLLFIHPDKEQSRTITVREAARLQSFPDDFEFKESMGYNYKMIGNAVPVNMAKYIALGFAKYINEKNEHFSSL